MYNFQAMIEPMSNFYLFYFNKYIFLNSTSECNDIFANYFILVAHVENIFIKDTFILFIYPFDEYLKLHVTTSTSG